MQARGARARVGDTTNKLEVRRRLPDLSRPLKSWLVRGVWQNAPTALPQLLAQRHPEALQARWSGVLSESQVEVGTRGPRWSQAMEREDHCKF